MPACFSRTLRQPHSASSPSLSPGDACHQLFRPAGPWEMCSCIDDCITSSYLLVDDIPSRWEIQRSASGWVAVSGTSHFSVSSSAHRPNEPCCGCLHPVDDSAGANPIPTISFVSFWAGLAMSVRLFREAFNSPYPLDQQHLWLTPLRMDQPHAAMWLPIAPRKECPVNCPASENLP
jgi:hypothetical protein